MKRFVVTLLWILVTAALASAQSTGYFPQIANGIQNDGVTWKTTIYVTNPAPSGTFEANGTVTFTTSNGSSFPISFIDSTGASAGTGTISFSLTGGQTKKFVSTGTGALVVGYGTLSSNFTVYGVALFSEFAANGTLISEASYQSTPGGTKQSILVDTQSGFDTGIAYANPNQSGVTITFQLMNTSGIAVTPSTQQTLSGRQQTAVFVKGGLFPSAPPLAGTLQILTPGAPISVVGLRFSSTGLFTTLPPMTLAGLFSPAFEWLEQRPWLNPLTSFARLLGGLQFRIG